MQHQTGITKGEYVAKSGKLIKIRVEFKDEKIADVRITGDFFLHPEEKLEELEKNLKNKNPDETSTTIRETLNGCEYAGISPELIEQGIKKAWLNRK